MNKHLKISVALLSSVFVLAACGQNNSAQTTQAAQETTQTNNKKTKKCEDPRPVRVGPIANEVPQPVFPDRGGRLLRQNVHCRLP